VNLNGVIHPDSSVQIQPFVRFIRRDHALLWPPLVRQLFLPHPLAARLIILQPPWNRQIATICSIVQRFVIGKPGRVQMREISPPRRGLFCNLWIVSDGLEAWGLRFCN
jgi:hypothetical protein